MGIIRFISIPPVIRWQQSWAKVLEAPKQMTFISRFLFSW